MIAFDSFPWMTAVLIYMVCEFIISGYLDWRQYRYLKKGILPPILVPLIDEETFRKSVDYALDRLVFSFFSSAFSVCLVFALLLTYFYVYIWDIAFKSVQKPLLSVPLEYWHSLVFLGLLHVIMLFVELPFSLYNDFVIEEKHGFNKKTVVLFIKDLLITQVLTIIIGVPVVWGTIYLVHKGGESFYIYLWIFIVVVSFIMLLIYPNVIAPLFNKFEQLKNEELREQIESLAKQLNFPLKKIYQIDDSKRSAHSNAYFYGFGRRKYIVLYDTLLEVSSNKVTAVVAHEMGHWKYSHVLKGILIELVTLMITLYLFKAIFFHSNIYESFGFSTDRIGKPVIIGLFLFTKVFDPVSYILARISVCVTRIFEFNADAFAAQLGKHEDLEQALIHISKQNLSAITDPVYAWFYSSHPQLTERIEHLRNLQKNLRREKVE